MGVIQKLRKILSLLSLVYAILRALLAMNFRLAKELIRGLSLTSVPTDLPPWEMIPFDYKVDWFAQADREGQVIDWFSSQEGRRPVSRPGSKP